MSDTVISCEGISKRYFVNRQQGYKLLSDSLGQLVAAPYRRFRRMLRGSSNGDNHAANTIWALKDVSFEVNRGEVIGIIGHNGAGKSTLLKILSRITRPTAGLVHVHGRVGSLLEVGTGFHPELTGRENIFLNGTILGMKKSEIKRRFDEIVAFAEIEKFIDMPVKRYSSGMHMRLGFAVAAHLETEILFVDEVLAVGDAGFQKKCIGKISDVASWGKTVLFVSHNMNAIRRLCPRALLLGQGKLLANDLTDEVTSRYLSGIISRESPATWIDITDVQRSGSGKIKCLAVWYSSFSEHTSNRPFSKGPLEIRLNIYSEVARSVGSVAATLYDQYGTKLINADTISLGREVPLTKGSNILRLRIKELNINPGTYLLGVWIADPIGETFDYIESALKIEVVDLETENFGLRATFDGAVPCEFEVSSLSQA